MRNTIGLGRAEAVRYEYLRRVILASAYRNPLHEQLYEFPSLAASLRGIFLYLRHALPERQEPRRGIGGGQSVLLSRDKVSLDALQQ
jgi:hypothetical protein